MRCNGRGGCGVVGWWGCWCGCGCCCCCARWRAESEAVEAGEHLARQLPDGCAWVPLRLWVLLVVLILVLVLVVRPLVCGGKGPTWAADVRLLLVRGEVSTGAVRRE